MVLGPFVFGVGTIDVVVTFGLPRGGTHAVRFQCDAQVRYEHQHLVRTAITQAQVTVANVLRVDVDGDRVFDYVADI